MQLVIDEGLLNVTTADDLRRRLGRGLLKDIHAQAMYTLGSWQYEDRREHSAPSDAFRCTMAATLNPFSATGKCMELSCRLAAARAFSQSLGLYVEEAIVTDPLISIFVDDAFSERHLTPKQLAERMHVTFQVFKTIRPLIEDGVVRFSSPGKVACAHCLREKQRLTARGTEYVEGLVADAGLALEVIPQRNGKGARVSLSCPALLSGGHDVVVTQDLNAVRAKPFLALAKRRNKGGLFSKQDSKLIAACVSAFVYMYLGDVGACQQE
jgi:glutaredoxin